MQNKKVFSLRRLRLKVLVLSAMWTDVQWQVFHDFANFTFYNDVQHST